jgi:hypothetical protein
MIVVGLDLSLTSAGIAVLVDGRPKTITHVGHGGKNGASYAQRSRRVVSQCRAVMRIVEATVGSTMGMVIEGTPLWPRLDLAVIEGPSYGSEYGDAFDRAGLWHGVYAALAAKRIPIAVIAPPSLKLWFTGAGDASKLRMLDTARGMFREPISTNDEADAIALATAGAHWLGDPIPFEPSERQLGALTKVEWPVRA